VVVAVVLSVSEDGKDGNEEEDEEVEKRLHTPRFGTTVVKG